MPNRSKRIRKLSIDRKLGLLFGLAALFCLVVSTAGFAVTLFYYSQNSFKQELSSVSNVVASTSRAALVFRDSEAGTRVLGALRAKPNIIYAGLFDIDGKLLSDYGTRPVGMAAPAILPNEERVWSSNYLTTSVPVRLDNDVLGVLVVVASLDTLYQQLELFTLITIFIALVTAGGSLFFRHVLRQTVSVPIVALRDAALRVKLTNDYTTRISPDLESYDEVGQLIGTFNKMLQQLQERDSALVQAKNKAEDADRLKSLFLATVSHELRTPLHTILGMTREVLESPLSGEQREMLEIVNGSGSLLISIINDILDFSKIEAGRLQLSITDVDLTELLTKAVRMFDLAAQRKQLVLSVHVAPDVPKILSIDTNRLTQVLVNLLANAIKFTDAGSVSVEVKMTGLNDKERTARLHFVVTDTGIGIPAGQVATIFESFTQIQRTGDQIEGTGLGLAISSKLVMLMGGAIWADSTLGRGSSFHFTIDAKIPTAAQEKKVRRSKQQFAEEKSLESESIAPGSAKRTILVVEDNLVNRKLAHRVLSKAGYDIKIAHNGKECLDILESSTVDLILMDLNMPVMDGKEATRRIRAKEKSAGGHVPIVALSANAVDDQGAECLDLGMEAFLMKPLDRETLLQTIAKIISSYTATIDSVRGDIDRTHGVRVE